MPDMRPRPVVVERIRALSSRAGRALVNGGIDPRASTDLGWVWLNIGSADIGWTLVERLGKREMADELKALKDVPWEICEVAGMSLGFEDSMTALDLCADAVFLACREPAKARGRFYDVADLRQLGAQLAAPPSIRGWIDSFLAEPDLTLLEECRHALAHRHVRRHYAVTLSPGVPVERALSEITTFAHGGAGRSRGSIDALIPRLVRFAERQAESVCEAILRDFPAPP